MAELNRFAGPVEIRGKNYRKVLQPLDFTPIDSEVYELKDDAFGLGGIRERGFEGCEIPPHGGVH
jgi:hypothetical protein